MLLDNSGLKQTAEQAKSEACGLQCFSFSVSFGRKSSYIRGRLSKLILTLKWHKGPKISCEPKVQHMPLSMQL